MSSLLSVVIVVYKSEKHIGPCLDTLAQTNDIGTRLEVLVVDNETEGVGERQRRLAVEHPNLGLRCIANDLNGGYGQGNNLGIRHATAPLVLIMNPDVRLTGTTPGRICDAFDRDGKLALLGMRQMLGNGGRGRSFLWASGLPAGLAGSALLWFSNRYGCFFPRWECVQGSCFALRKSVFESIGMFDESVFMYGEERDIHGRLRKLHDIRIACDWNMSYQHLTDRRDFSFDATVKSWEVSARWCRTNGIHEKTFWQQLHRHLGLSLLWNRIRPGRDHAKSVAFLGKLQAFVSSRWRESLESNGTEP